MTIMMRLLCCLLSLLTLHHSTSVKNDSILIVGGGLSGLAAALELERHGYSTIIVEATSRLGGRVSSHSPQVELGGTYLHGSNNTLARLLQHYQLATVVSGGASQHPGKESAVWTFERRLLNKTSTEERSATLYKTWLERTQIELQNYTCTTGDETELAQENVQKMSEQVIHNLTAGSLLDRALLHFELAMFFEHDLGVPFSYISLKGLDNNWGWMEHAGPDLVVRDGLSTLVQAMRNDIQGNILLTSPVERISYSNGTCTLTLQNNTQALTSSACIVTIPIGVLKKHHATLFDPPLPPQKQDALRRAGVAAYNTLVLTWNKPICQAGAYYPLSSNSHENPLASGFVCPHVLRSNATESTITQFYISGSQYDFDNIQFWKRHAVDVINQVLLAHGEQYTMRETDILDFAISKWHSDPYTLGSYSSPTTSTRGNTDRAVLQQSLGNIVYFAGEHTNTCGRYQSLDGAYDSGILAARQFVSRFESRTSPFQSIQQTCDKTTNLEMMR